MLDKLNLILPQFFTFFWVKKYIIKLKIVINKKTIRILNEFQKREGILIADEITSGFRTKELTFSRRYGLRPDLLTLGKAMGSGYAISAVGYLKELDRVEKLNNVFASSTFWTEEIGLKAAYLTTKLFEKSNIDIINKIELATKEIKNKIRLACEINEFNLEINNHPTLVYSKITYKEYDPKLVKTLICNLMLEQKILFSTNIYPALTHSRTLINYFGKSLAKCLKEASLILDESNENDIIKKYGIVDDGFGRLTK